ncbi:MULTISPECIES: N-6 DNA methylase [Streptomyces]|uniref:Restriction endonuclease subunit M n=1 Tax=Streptomyces viridochromogenes TaxID=1938 RepID=A0A0L8L0K5_STRVR|nr:MULTISPECIES: N-6 DNA methylase [Streptomyces]KOG31753.1 restriction endonuclease subunit M [Streptomyces viridochromogenes]
MTAAGIARLAGVGRAAVSNWRRRHPDFPKPVGGTEASPSFALADVEQWLRDQGKLAEVPLRERVWQQIAGHPAGAVTALVHAGCALLLVRERSAAWPSLAELPDERLVEVLPVALEETLGERLGHARPVPTPTSSALAASVPLLRGAAELAAETGVRPAFEFLLGRHLDANPRQYTLTPSGPAALMAALAVGTDTSVGEGATTGAGTGTSTATGAGTGTSTATGAGTVDEAGGAPVTVLDPACGTGSLLTAVERPGAFCGQDADPDLAALTALRLALATDADIRVRSGDSLRADAFPSLAADAVLCHPPFNERNWGHDELAYDPRFEYGFPARTESELAWVQHALARLRPGGTAVLLMPPAAASRRSGRRIRADLLRRGALRAVVALPAGAAPPYGIPLHLWVLRRPVPGERSPAELLLVDTASEHAGPARDARDRIDWPSVQTAVLEAWTPFDRDGSIAGTPGASRSVPVIELLDDDVDLAPARHLPPPAAAEGAAQLAGVRERLTETLRRTRELTPPPVTDPATAGGGPVGRPTTTVGELARAGALALRAGGVGTTPAASPVAVLTDHDVLAAQPPSGTLPDGPPEEPVLLAAGDVVVPVLGGGAAVRVVDASAEGAALGRNLQLLRPDPAALDPWFLAGFLRATANNRQASSYASTATRLDVRRLQLPRLPLAEQRRFGARFRALAEFEEELRQASRLGDQLVQGLYDGLADGTVAP